MKKVLTLTNKRNFEQNYLIQVSCAMILVRFSTHQKQQVEIDYSHLQSIDTISASMLKILFTTCELNGYVC